MPDVKRIGPEYRGLAPAGKGKTEAVNSAFSASMIVHCRRNEFVDPRPGSLLMKKEMLYPDTDYCGQSSTPSRVPHSCRRGFYQTDLESVT